MIRVEGKKGRRTIIGEGETRAQAQGRAMAEWRRVYDEMPKGVKFSVVSGAAPAAPSKPKSKAKAKKTAAPTSSTTSSTSKPKAGPKVPVGDLAYHSRLVVGTTSAGSVRDVGMTHSLDGARALVASKAVDGTVHVLLTVENVYQNAGRQAAGSTRLDARQLAYRDRVVLGTKANGELIDVQVVPGGLDKARAVAQAMNASRAIVTTVHQAFQG